jgi:hypothetical protein
MQQMRLVVRTRLGNTHTHTRLLRVRDPGEAARVSSSTSTRQLRKNMSPCTRVSPERDAAILIATHLSSAPKSCLSRLDQFTRGHDVEMADLEY